MIVKEQSFQIRKIEKADGVWILYPKLKDVAPIELNADVVNGKLPPVWKWPWQSHKLSITRYDDFISYAEMDGKVLFDIAETDFPEHIKQELARARAIDSTYNQFRKDYDASVQKMLAEYLPSIEKVPNLEDAIAKLPIGWKMFLKIRLPYLYHEDKAQELYLLYRLTDIAERIYQRHVDDEAPLSVVFAYHELSIKLLEDFGYDEVCIDAIEQDADYHKHDSYGLYREVKRALAESLPEAPKRLQYYLNFLVRKMLTSYAEDFATLICKRPRDLFGDTINTDREAYRYLAADMSLPLFSSFILNEKFDKAQIEALMMEA
ncbi:MAG: hypothetical protein J6Y91_01495 [Alphaproteobacteria bacterium]|nr:hypothetical protein [Alphaproteobacteria bacterium]